MTRNLKNFARIFPCTSDKSAVLQEKKTRMSFFFFFAAQDVNISRGNKYLEATFGALRSSVAYAVSVGAALRDRRPTGRSVKDW